MMGFYKTVAAAVLLAATCMQTAAATAILETTGFSSCTTDADVQVQTVAIRYDNDAQTVTFDVAGTNALAQNVTALLNVTAYGESVYSYTFNPCASGTYVTQLCPLPAGNFSASGSLAIPAAYADLVPSIAFQIPDIDAEATLRLTALADGSDVACITAQVSNGKTVDIPAVSYVSASVAGVALLMSGVSAVSAAMAAGAGGGGLAGGTAAAGGLGTPPSPSFTEVFGWFQGMALNGMLSVSYPQVYRSFSQNFAFATGLVQWTRLQQSIDSFRAATGGNLTANSVAYLQNATLVFADGSTATPSTSAIKRAVWARGLALALDAIETSINGTSDATAASSSNSTSSLTVQMAITGIEAFVEELSIPSSNTFMTVLLVVAIAIAAITFGLLLVKVVLEVWALVGRFPASLAGFRTHYWGSIGRAITTLILLLYGVWVVYCVFQFTHGDSWAAKLLAGLTLGLFTAVLVFFTVQIARTAKRLRAAEGDAGGLYDDQRLWDRYSLFYESYRRPYWWLFVPTIAYMLAKGLVLALGEDHGLAQTVAQMVLEVAMLGLLLWSRPYARRSGNVINIVIQVVRVLSVVCIFVFVDALGMAETTQTVTGVVLIAIQAALSGLLVLLIAWNAIVACCKENPHKKRRRELEQGRDDALTPLDARNTLLLAAQGTPDNEKTKNAAFAVANVGGAKRLSALSVLSASSTRPSVSEKAGLVAAAAPPAMSRPPVPREPPSEAPSRLLSVTTTLSSSSRAVPIGVATADLGGRPLTPSTFTVGSADARAGLLRHASPISQAPLSAGLDARQPTLPNLGFDVNGPGRSDSRSNNVYSPFPSQSYRPFQGGGGGPWEPRRA